MTHRPLTCADRAPQIGDVVAACTPYSHLRGPLLIVDFHGDECVPVAETVLGYRGYIWGFFERYRYVSRADGGTLTVEIEEALP